MSKRITRVTAPIAKAVDLDAVKKHLRIDWDSDDMQLRDLVDAAAEWVEISVGRTLIDTTWRVDLDGWPGEWGVYLAFPPLISVEHVKYLDVDGALQTLDAAEWFVAADSFLPATLHVLQENLPTIKADRPNAVQVTYRAGFGAVAASVPPRARQAILLLVGHWWENREAVLVGQPSGELAIGLASLLRTLKTGHVAGVE